MVQKLLYLFLTMTLIGCAAMQERMNPVGAAQRYGCKIVPAHSQKNGEAVPLSYHCPKSTPTRFTSRYSCTWVNSYVKRDGTSVSGHSRCNFPTRNYRSSNSSGNCHWVNGYRRKNGSYVRGHRRCR